MAQHKKLSPNSFGSHGNLTTTQSDSLSYRPRAITENSSCNSKALLNDADGTKDRHYHHHRDDSPAEISPTDSGRRPGRVTTRRRHFSAPPIARSSKIRNAPLSWAHTVMNTNESLRSTLRVQIRDKEIKSTFHQDTSMKWGDFTDDTSHNISGPDKTAIWMDQSPKKMTISHFDEGERSVQSPVTATADIHALEHRFGEKQVDAKAKNMASPKDESCCYVTVDILNDMQDNLTSDSSAFCNGLSSIDTFLDIDTCCLGTASFTSITSVENTGNELFTSPNVDTNSSSEEDVKGPTSEVCFQEIPSNGQCSESTRNRYVSEKKLQNEKREKISESKIVKDEMIFEPLSMTKNRLYLGNSALDDSTHIGYANGYSENKHTYTNDMRDESTCDNTDKTDKTITHSSISQLSIIGQQKSHNKVYSLKCCKSANNKARGNGNSMTESKSNLDPLYASDNSDNSCEDSDTIRDDEITYTDFITCSSSKQMSSGEGGMQEVDDISRDPRISESKLNRKPKKGTYRKRRLFACKGRGRKMAERRCPKCTRHNHSSAKDDIVARTVRYTMAPFLRDTSGRIKYERKDGKYICRGVRKKQPRALDINFNSGEIKLNTEAKASSFIGEYLFELWKNQCLCDVKLRPQGGSFLAHKIVLAAFSDAFCPCEPVPAPSLSVDMPDTTSEAVYQVLLYLYTSEMELSDDTMEDVLNAALFLGVSDVVELIKDILLNPTKDNFNLYLEIAQRLQLPITLMNMPQLIREHLHDVWDSVHYKILTLDDVMTILSDQELLVNSESDILEAVCKWAEYRFPERIPDAITLMQHVNFVCIDPGMLSKTAEKYEHIFDHKDLQQVLAHIYKSFAVNSIVKDASGYFPESNLCKIQKHAETGVRPRDSDEYRTPVYHAGQNPPNPINPLSQNPTHPQTIQSGEPFSSKTATRDDSNPRWQSHPELLMDSKTTSISLPITDKAKLATQQTIKTINDQFQRVFGPKATSTAMNYCTRRRTPGRGNKEADDGTPQTTSQRYDPMANSLGKKTDASSGTPKRDFDARKSYAGNMGRGELGLDDCNTCDKAKFGKGTGGSIIEHGEKYAKFASNIHERQTLPFNVPKSRGGMDTQRDAPKDMFLGSNQKGEQPDIPTDEVQLPEFGMLSPCPDQPHCSRAIQRRLLFPSLDGSGKRGVGSLSSAMHDRSHNHLRFDN